MLSVTLHYIDCHSDECQDDVSFGMCVVKQHYSSFSRQIHESVLIFLNKQHVLNSRSQYNRCQVHRLTVRLDDKKEEVREALNVAKVDKLRGRGLTDSSYVLPI